MSLTNDDALDIMVAIGRQALERGKVEQALTIFGGVLTKAPKHTVAWFSLGRAHLLKGSHDHAALCYYRAAVLARTQKRLPNNLPRLARDNQVLCGERVLPRDWLPALQDPQMAECWCAALDHIAATAAAAAVRVATDQDGTAEGGTSSNNISQRRPPSWRPARALVVGGLGLQALQLQALLTAHFRTAVAAAAASTAAGAATGGAAGSDATATTAGGKEGREGGSHSAVAGPTDGSVEASAAAGPSGNDTTSATGGGEAAAAAAAAAAGAVPSPPPSAAAETAASVTWVLSDELSKTLGAQMGAAAGMPRSELHVVNGWREGVEAMEAATAVVAAKAAEAAAAAAAVKEGEGTQAPNGSSSGSGAAVMVDVLVAAGVCTARLALKEWSAALEQARPLLSPHAVLCPRAARLVGVLAASEDLLAMNEVHLDWMRQDSGGLEYGSANELLWRPARSMQVSGFGYTLLSEPFPLLPQVTARELLNQHEQQQQQQQKQKQRHVEVTATAAGRVDCLICWMEYELVPGVWMSYAPHEMQGRSDPPALSPHVWQRVHYLSARPVAEAGRVLVFQVTQSGGDSGEELRVEYDEDVTAVQHVPAAAAPSSSSAAASSSQEGEQEEEGLRLLLPAGEPLLPAGEPLSPGDGEESSSEEGEAPDAGGDDDAIRLSGNGGGTAKAKEGTTEGATVPAVAAAAQAGLILPYHMSMLNDRVRTRCYAEGIRSAVAEAQSRHPSQPLVVLDVGAGTGLLSMLAARAGAQCVVGCERELALAVAAGALTAANHLNDHVKLVQAHSNNLRVAPAAPPPPAPPLAETAVQSATPPAAAAAAQSESSSAGGGAGGAVAKGEAEEAAAAAKGEAEPEEGKAHHLPARAGLVVHEIFGTDPLSEHILPSMGQVQESLAAPDALYLPSAFRLVAALAHSSLLESRMRAVRPPAPPPPPPPPPPTQMHLAAQRFRPPSGGDGAPGLMTPGGGSDQGHSVSSVLGPVETARLARVLPAAATTALQPWAPWKAEVDLLRVPDLLLLTEPVAVSTLRLDTRPLPRAYRAAALAVPCAPTPLAQRFRRHGPGGEELEQGEQEERLVAQQAAVESPAAAARGGGSGSGNSGSAATSAAAASTISGNCIVYWFEADCGAGGWLSTCPGSASTYYGHWVQNVEFLEEPLPLPGTEPGIEPGVAVGAAVAAAAQQGLRVRLRAECLVDRVRMAGEWVQLEEAGDEEEEEEESGNGAGSGSESD